MTAIDGNTVAFDAPITASIARRQSPSRWTPFQFSTTTVTTGSVTGRDS